MIFWGLGKMQFNIQGVAHNPVSWIENIDSMISKDTQHLIQETANETDQNYGENKQVKQVTTVKHARE